MAISSSADKIGDDVLGDVFDRVEENIDGDKVSVGTILSSFEDRSFGALLTVVGAVAALPVVGAIPGVSIVTGTLAVLIAGQFLFGRDNPWIPATLRDRAVSADTLKKAISESRSVVGWIDSVVKPRLTWLIKGDVATRLAALVVCQLAVAMMPLALVPWGVQPPATAILLFGIALLGRDGLFALLAYILAATTIVVLSISVSTISSFISSLFGN
jgi:hypothetical protein